MTALSFLDTKRLQSANDPNVLVAQHGCAKLRNGVHDFASKVHKRAVWNHCTEHPEAPKRVLTGGGGEEPLANRRQENPPERTGG
jgi:hypothetical protein